MNPATEDWVELIAVCRVVNRARTGHRFASLEWTRGGTKTFANAAVEKATEAVYDGLSFDGGHHKQFYLAEVARALGIDISEWHDDELGMPA